MSHPQPRGALSPSECLTTRAGEVLAAIIFFNEGLRMPNFIRCLPNLKERLLVYSILEKEKSSLLNKREPWQIILTKLIDAHGIFAQSGIVLCTQLGDSPQ